jgi:hypothetical protein
LEFRKSLDNPYLDLKAEYIGEHPDGDVKIQLSVTGKKSDPRVVFELYRLQTNGIFALESRPQKDAIYFLATGSFTDESRQSDLTNLPKNAGFSVANMIINEALPSSAKEYLRSVELEYGETSQYKVKLEATYSDITVRFGGAFASGQYGYSQDASVLFPLSKFITFRNAEDFQFLIEQHIAGTQGSSNSIFQQPPWMGTLQWRWTP